MEHQTVTTDRGLQFESSLFDPTMQFLGCERQRTTAYYPAANGLVERFHRQLKVSLMARNIGADWIDHLLFVLLGIRATIKTDLDACPTELVYGSSLRLLGKIIIAFSKPHPGDIVYNEGRMDLRQLPLARKHLRLALIEDSSVTPTFSSRCGLIRKQLQPPYDGPYKVLNRADKMFTILLNGKEIVGTDSLKAVLLILNKSTTQTQKTITLRILLNMFLH